MEAFMYKMRLIALGWEFVPARNSPEKEDEQSQPES